MYIVLEPEDLKRMSPDLRRALGDFLSGTKLNQNPLDISSKQATQMVGSLAQGNMLGVSSRKILSALGRDGSVPKTEVPRGVVSALERRARKVSKQQGKFIIDGGDEIRVSPKTQQALKQAFGGKNSALTGFGNQKKR